MLPAMRRALALAVAGVVALGGCGGGATERGDVTKAVRVWTAYMADGNAREMCARMTPAAQEEMLNYAQAYTAIPPSASCVVNAVRFIRKLPANGLRQARDADVDQIHIEGSVATVRMAHGGPNEVVLRRQGGAWKIDHAFRRGWRLLGAPSFGLTGG